MALCDNCSIYSPIYDELRQNSDDVIKEGENTVEKRFCKMYDEAIDNNILNGKKPCKYYTKIPEK